MRTSYNIIKLKLYNLKRIMYSLNIVYLYIYPLTFVKIATVFNILLYNRPELTMGRACRPTDPLINFYD